MNDAEKKVKEILEKHGWHVCKASYPDFIIWNDAKIYCFVEVKNNLYKDRLTANQSKSFRILRELEVPVAVVYLNQTTDEIKNDIKRYAHTGHYVDFVTFQDVKEDVEKLLWRLYNNASHNK